MGWLRLDDGFAMHPKIAALSDHGYRAWTKVLLYCARYRTEGDVAEQAFNELGIDRKLRRTYVEVGLLDEDEFGLLSVHDWGDFNKSDPTNAERQKRFREARKKQKSNAGSNAGSNAPDRYEVTESNADSPLRDLAPAHARAGDPSTSSTEPQPDQRLQETDEPEPILEPRLRDL